MKISNCTSTAADYCASHCIYSQPVQPADQTSGQCTAESQFTAVEINSQLLQQLIRQKVILLEDIRCKDEKGKQLIHKTLLQCIECKQQQSNRQ